MRPGSGKSRLAIVGEPTVPDSPQSIGTGLPRWVEIVLSAIGIVFAAPFLLIVALLLRCSSRGPVLFRQERIGRDGRPFTLFKFRSMRVDAAGPQVTSAHDDRVTRVGRFLRSTKLDELPELWNVLRGDMSIVGPRPEVTRYVDLSNPLWKATLSVRPGLTDMVTLRLRNEEALMSRVEDREEFYLRVLQPMKLRGYVDFLSRRSWFQDVRVILLTVFAALIPELVPAPSVKEITASMEETVLRDDYRVRVVWRGLLSRFAQVLIDVEILVAAFVVAYLLRFDFNVPTREISRAFVQLPLVVLIQFVALAATGVFRFVWRYIGMADLGAFNRAALMSAIPLIAIRFLAPEVIAYFRVPLSVIFIDTMLAFGGLLGVRVMRRLSYESGERAERATTAPAHRKRALIAGAGRAGVVAAREIAGRSDLGLALLGFVDDDPAKQRTLIQGLEVLGTTEDLPRLARDLRVEQVVIAIAQTPGDELQRIVDLCRTAEVEVLVLPGLYQILDGSVRVERV